MGKSIKHNSCSGQKSILGALFFFSFPPNISLIFVQLLLAFNELTGVFSLSLPKHFSHLSSPKSFHQLTLHLICISGVQKYNLDTCHLSAKQCFLFSNHNVCSLCAKDLVCERGILSRSLKPLSNIGHVILADPI